MRGMLGCERSMWPLAFAAAVAAGVVSGMAQRVDDLDQAAVRWVDDTLNAMSVDEQVGQLVVGSVESGFLSTDSDAYDRLARLVRDDHVGGFHVFGVTDVAPSILLNPAPATAALGQPLAVASLLNRLQTISKVPLLNSADFETGLGFRLSGATTFPREMALGAAAAGDPVEGVRLVRESARLTAMEARAIGVHVNFAPVADVNSNARNPVINTRSFGEDPALVASLVEAYVDGARAGGIATALKHFPGHGDTDVDSHLGLPIVTASRERVEAVELQPFRRGIEAGADAVMAAHIEVPSLDPRPSTPATFSLPILDGLLRTGLKFHGVVYTDSMSMDAIVKLAAPGEAAVRAVAAGADQVVDSPDPAAAIEALKAAVRSGRIGRVRIADSVRRVLRLKALAGLHLHRRVDLESVADAVGGRAHQSLANEATARSITLIKDEHETVPLRLNRDTPMLYLSVLDYPGGNWQTGVPSRTFLPELKRRWPRVTAIEISDRTPSSELDLVRAMAPRFGAIVAAVFVRTVSRSGRMDLAPQPAQLLKDIGRVAEADGVPFIACVFGNPYTAEVVRDIPSLLLTYDFGAQPELAAVRAVAGEAPIGGKLPISFPGLFPRGHGLMRAQVNR